MPLGQGLGLCIKVLNMSALDPTSRHHLTPSQNAMMRKLYMSPNYTAPIRKGTGEALEVRGYALALPRGRWRLTDKGVRQWLEGFDRKSAVRS